MDSLGTAEQDHVLALLEAQDVTVASRSAARVLITGSTEQAVETLARRIHAGGPRAQMPFVQQWAGDFPVGPGALNQYCVRLLDAAAGGSVFVSAIEKTPAIVQDAILDLLGQLESARRPSATIRLVSGTTVSLFDRVVEGTFSGRLFYRLNVIHLMASDRPAEVAL